MNTRFFAWTASAVSNRRRAALCFGLTLSTAVAISMASVAGATAKRAGGARAGGCGTVPTLAPKGSRAGLAAIPSGSRSQYNGFNHPVAVSAWAHKKPKYGHRLTVGVSTQIPNNSFTQQLGAALSPKVLKAEIPHLKRVITYGYPLTSSGLSTEIQQVHELIQQKVSAIIALPLSPQAFVPLAKQAYKAGIPFISVQNITPSPYAINISANGAAAGLTSAAWLANEIGKKGTVLGVQGIPSVQVNTDIMQGLGEGFAQCHGISFVTSIIGGFVESTAKSQMLTYLSTHPSSVSGVTEPSTMGSGIVQAFQQNGRVPPPMVLGNPAAGDLVYWTQHKKTYKAIGFSDPSGDQARGAAFAITEMVNGHGPKIDMLIAKTAVITKANLSSWAVRGASMGDDNDVTGPSGKREWLPNKYLQRFFN